MASGNQKGAIRRIAENRRARHEYEIEDQLEAGLVLVGTEVKSMRAGKANIAEAWIRFEDGEAWLVDAHVSPYPQAHQFNHEPRRPRKLLMKKGELDKWRRRVVERGLSAIPLRLYFNGAHVKVEIGLGRGRKLHDKRHALKDRQDQREIDRARRDH